MQRVIVPLILLAVCVGALIVADNLGTTDLTDPITEPIGAVDTPLLSARRLPESLTLPGAAEVLVDQLGDVVNAADGLSCVVVSENGRPLFSHPPDRPGAEPARFTPASTMKILTGYAALEILGEDYTFTTRLMAEAAPVDGVLQGDLYLVGGGDPLLMTADYAASFKRRIDIRTPIEQLAADFAATGVTTIVGAVVPVERRYDEVRYIETWPPRFAEQGQAGPLSSMMINQGFTAWPERQARIDGAGPTAAGDPAIAAARFFDDLLEAEGLVINAGSRRVSDDVDLADLVPLGEIESPPLSEIVREMLVFSDNTTAEALMKEIGRSATGEAGTTRDGIDEVVDLLARSGITPLGLPPLDGSGLDAGTKISCQTLVDVLASSGFDSPLGAAMPTAGEDGTLADRFVTSPARGRLHAKTGSLLDTTALAGWVVAEDGHILEFAYLLNELDQDGIAEAVVDVQEDLGEALVEYPLGPDIVEIAPDGQVERPGGPIEPPLPEPDDDATDGESEGDGESEEDGDPTDSGSDGEDEDDN